MNDILHQKKYGRTPLVVAIINGHLDVVKYLINKEIEEYGPIPQQDKLNYAEIASQEARHMAHSRLRKDYYDIEHYIMNHDIEGK